MPFMSGSSDRPFSFLIAVAIGLTARYVTKLLNKSRNRAMYAKLETLPANEVTHTWLKTLATISIPFQFTLLIELIVSLIGLVVVDRTFPDFTGFYLILLLVGLILRAGLKWMNIVYLTNLSLEKKNEVAEYFNENMDSAVDRVLKDPSVEAYLSARPAFLRNQILKRMRNLKPIKN